MEVEFLEYSHSKEFYVSLKSWQEEMFLKPQVKLNLILLL